MKNPNGHRLKTECYLAKLLGAALMSLEIILRYLSRLVSFQLLQAVK